MEPFPGDPEESTEDLTEKRKFRLKSLRTRLFGKKRAGDDKDGQLSHSASDITAGQALASEDDLACSQGALGLRALSHDSIFMAEQDLPGPEETSRVLSQENVHGKIKALQEKLQQQNMRLGPPRPARPIRRQDDGSEDDSSPRRPPEICPLPASPRGHSPLGAGSGEEEQASSRPLSPVVGPPPSDAPRPPPAPSLALRPAPSPSVLPPSPAPLDFGSPARSGACLDSSAARHRMSVKPRNQRARAQSRRLATESRPRSESLDDLERPPSEKNEEAAAVVKDAMRLRSHSTHVLGAGAGAGGSTGSAAPRPGAPLKTPEPTPLQSAAPPKAREAPRSSGPSSSSIPPRRPSPQGQTPTPLVPDCPAPVPLTTPSPPAAPPQKPAAEPSSSGKPPQQTSSAALPKPELRDRGEEGTGSEQAPPPPAPLVTPDPESQKKTPVSSARPSASLSAVVAIKTSSLRRGSQERACQGKSTGPPVGQEDPVAPETPVSSARPSASLSAVVAIKTSSLRRGSQGKATGPPVGQEDPVAPEARSTGGTQRGASGASAAFKFSISSARAADQGRPRAGSFLALVEQAGAGLRKEGRGEGSAVEAKITTDTGTVATAAAESREEGAAEEATEATEDVREEEEEEEEAKTAFGVKLRSTSQSLKYRSEAAVSSGQSDPSVKRYSAEAGLMAPSLAPFDPPSSGPLGADRRVNMADLSLKKPPGNISPTAATLSAPAGSAPPPPPTPLKDAQPTPSPDNNNAPAPATSSGPPGDAPPPQAAPPLPRAAPQAEVSWMSLAMAKTRTLQHLLTSRLPREMPGRQQAAPPRPQTEPQPQPQTQMPKQADGELETQTVTPSLTRDAASPSQTEKRLPPAETARAPVSQTTASQPQTTKGPPCTPSVTQPQTQTPGGPPKTKTQTAKPTVTQTTAYQTHTGGNLSQTQNRPAQQPTATTEPPAAQFSPRFSQVNQQQPNLRTTQPLLRSLPRSLPPQTRGETPSQAPLSSSTLSSSPRSLPSQPTWTSRGLHSDPQPKPTPQAQGSATPPAPPPAPAPVPGRGEKAGSSFPGRGEGASVPERRTTRQGAVEERAAALLEKQTEWTAPAGTKVPPQAPPGTKVPPQASAGTKVPPQAPAGTKVPPQAPAGTKVPPQAPAGTKVPPQASAETKVPPQAPAGTKVPPQASAGTKVELRKTPFETTPTESSVPPKTTPTSTPEGRPESSPAKVPGRLADGEDKWLRKNMPSSSSPSSSPTSSSPLQNISNSGQPSWMELAKRKSMAWGDKTMD